MIGLHTLVGSRFTRHQSRPVAWESRFIASDTCKVLAPPGKVASPDFSLDVFHFNSRNHICYDAS
jgi:hypothetical protein